MPELLEVVRPHNRSFVGFFEHELRAGIANGQIDPSVDVESTALLIVGTLHGTASAYMADPENVNPERLAQAMLDLLIGGIVIRDRA